MRISGIKYRFRVSLLNTKFKAVGAVYIVTKRTKKAGSGLAWLGNSKLGSLRQRNCVWSLANWAGHTDLCLWLFSRGFSCARHLKGLHAVYAVVESFHRHVLSRVPLYPARPSGSSNMCPNSSCMLACCCGRLKWRSRTGRPPHKPAGMRRSRPMSIPATIQAARNSRLRGCRQGLLSALDG